MPTEHELKENISDLLIWLERNRTKLAPFTVTYGKKYAKIIYEDRGAYCFIPLENMSTKKLGNVRQGDLLSSATWHAPAKHSRGYLFDKSTWEKAFGEYSMRYFRG